MHCTVHETDRSIKKLTNLLNNECSKDIRGSTFCSVYSETLEVKWDKYSNAKWRFGGFRYESNKCDVLFLYETVLQLIGYKQAVAGLVQLCDVITTASLKPEESTTFMSPVTWLFCIC